MRVVAAGKGDGAEKEKKALHLLVLARLVVAVTSTWLGVERSGSKEFKALQQLHNGQA